jgi:hypothetical protein
MNANQREIIKDVYTDYIRCCGRLDAVGFTSDMVYFFDKIRETDKKLDELLKEVYDEIPEGSW